MFKKLFGGEAKAAPRGHRRPEAGGPDGQSAQPRSLWPLRQIPERPVRACVVGRRPRRPPRRHAR
ncbi:hypothetical protein ACRAWD_11240 [Caulobacter segnis]